MAQDLFKKIISHCKEYGFIFQSSEIYDGLSAVYDYGQFGVELKNNLVKYWWDAVVYLNEDVVGLDSAIFMHPKVWEASGHVSAFNDPLIDNKDSQKRYRADMLVEDYLEKQEAKINKEIEKAAKRFGDSFDEEKFRTTNPRVINLQKKVDSLREKFVNALEKDDLDQLKQIIVDCDIADPETGSKNWTDVRKFNLMFETQLGSISEEATKLYLRPETAQGIFLNFLNVQKSGRMKIPFGIAQTGKAFRNEIVARQFIFRMREFEQMEMEFFIRPGEENKWFEYWKEARMNWYKALGFDESKLRFHDHEKLAHYAEAATDIQFEFPFGFKEIEGIHSRTDFDLGQQQKFSGKKLQYFDSELNESYVPYVIETSMGLDRLFLMILTASYCEEEIEKESGKTDERVVLRIPAFLAPVKLAILPLVNKDGLPEIAREIRDDLKFNFNCHYEEKDSIGRRYRRQDAIGTPFCITVDHQTIQDNTVTIRYRDTMNQERVPVNELNDIIQDKISLKKILGKLNK